MNLKTNKIMEGGINGDEFDDDVNTLTIPLYQVGTDDPTNTNMSREKQQRLQSWARRVSSSQRTGVIYSITLGVACLVLIILVLVLSSTIPEDLRIWLGCVNTVLIISFQIMTFIFRNDPIFAWHFIFGTGFFTGCGFMVSALHLICE